MDQTEKEKHFHQLPPKFSTLVTYKLVSNGNEFAQMNWTLHLSLPVFHLLNGCCTLNFHFILLW